MDQESPSVGQDSGNSMLTVLGEDVQRAVWGDDAPDYWARLSKEPPVRKGDVVWLTSSSSVHEAMHHPEVFSSGPDASFFGSETGLIPLQIDPPEHVRYRRLLDPLFAPRKMALLEEDLAAFAKSCIDRFAARGDCDFSDEFAVPFPIGTFLRLLGLPYEGLADFLRLKDAQIRPPGSTSEEAEATRVKSRAEIVQIFDQALNARMTDPQGDLLSYFVELEQTQRLTRDEVINICHLLLLAGLDTVTGTLEVAFGLLARRPDLQRELTDDPEVIPSAVEELLRWVVTSPTQARVATRDTGLEGCPIQKGDRVAVLLATENFDPDRFPDPTNVDLHRRPNSHVAFSEGVHRCLGSHLARIELRVALREWHRRIPRYGLADRFQVEYTPALRGIPHLALRFPAAS
jgi:cytochrome P450